MKSRFYLLTIHIVIFVLVITYTIPQTAYANTKITTGYNGQSNYNSNGCYMHNRAGSQYVNNLNYWLNTYGVSTNSFNRTEWLAWESDMASSEQGGNGRADSVAFFAFSGHTRGPVANPIEDARAHYFTDNASRLHSSEEADAANLAWSEVRLGRNNLRWLTMYTCNWLTNRGSSTLYERKMKTFEGMRLTMGFASTMYLDSREGSLYANLIYEGFYLKDAFISAAKYYQPQDTAGKITYARVSGYNLAANDRYYTSPTRAPKYVDSPGNFSTIQTEQIVCDGKKI